MKKIFVNKKNVRRIFVLALAYLLIVAGFLIGVFIFFYPVGSFFDGAITNSTRIYDRNGILLYETLNPEAGRTAKVALADVSKSFIAATIQVEDSNFYSHAGVDVLGIIRASFQNVESGKVVSGASTITQQLVRNVLGVNRERTVFQKVKEALFALRVSRSYSKDEVLELYVNKVYYGNLNYGIAAASYRYFGKHPRDLDLAESAFLAGLPQAPNRYDPFKHREESIQRQRYVLDLMRRAKVITDEEAQAAREEQLLFEPKSITIRAPHFVHTIIDELEERYGPQYATSGLSVKTTLDLNLNEKITDIAQNQITKLTAKNVTNASVVVLEPRTGAIVAMVGSVDYFDDSIEGKNNMTTALRQPGSAMKPITYAVAFEKGWHGATQVRDEPVRFFTADGQPYYPKNYDFEYHGIVSVREALANSYNIPAVQAIQFAGVADVLKKAHDMGITSLRESADHYGLALTLGDGEVSLVDLTHVYATLANGGQKQNLFDISEVKDASGKILFSRTAQAPTRVLGDDISYMLSSIMSDNEARIAQFGLTNLLQVDRPAAVKTGTTRNYKDNWTIGYTPDFAVGVWVGNSNNDPMQNVSGVMGAGPIWHDVMNEVHKSTPVHEFVPPPTVEKRLFDTQIEWISKNIDYSAVAVEKIDTITFRIIKPFDQDVFEFQSDVPADVQQIKLQTTPLEKGERLEWFVDGVALNSSNTQTNDSIFWPIVAGEHIIKAVKYAANKPLQEDSIRVTVEP